MSDTLGLPHIDIRNTFGATLIGAFIATTLYGLTTLQTYLFYIYYPQDTRNTKLLVAAIWILDTLHAAFMAYSVYFYLIFSYFNIASLSEGHWTLFLSVAFNTVIACVVQTFFLLKIHKLCPAKYKWGVTSVIGLCVLAHFAFGVETVTYEFIKGGELQRISEVRFIAATPFAIFAVLSDIMIAGALCYLLQGSRSGFKRTDTVISVLIVYAINRCLLTSVVAIVEVVVYCLMPNSLWYLAVDFFIGKLYANSLLASLNSRAALRAAHTVTANSIHLSNLEFGSSSSPRGTEPKPLAHAREVVITIDSASNNGDYNLPMRTSNSTGTGFFSGDKM